MTTIWEQKNPSFYLEVKTGDNVRHWRWGNGEVVGVVADHPHGLYYRVRFAEENVIAEVSAMAITKIGDKSNEQF